MNPFHYFEFRCNYLVCFINVTHLVLFKSLGSVRFLTFVFVIHITGLGCGGGGGGLSCGQNETF